MNWIMKPYANTSNEEFDIAVEQHLPLVKQIAHHQLRTRPVWTALCRHCWVRMTTAKLHKHINVCKDNPNREMRE